MKLYVIGDSWYDILDCEDELLSNRKSEDKHREQNLLHLFPKFFNFDKFPFHKYYKPVIDDNKGQYYTDKLNIGNMIDKVDLTYYLKPNNHSKDIMNNETGHPNYDDCVKIKTRLVETFKGRYTL
jgi:hypothetical protein